MTLGGGLDDVGYRAVIQNVGRFLSDAKAVQNSIDRVNSKLRNVGEAAGRAGRGLLSITAPVVALGGLGLRAGIQFESAFAGVRKTVDATEGQFQTLQRRFRDMAQEIPVTVQELSQIAETAGQLGISVGNIENFTRVMADLGVTTNLSSQEAATALARIANITGLPQNQFDRLGSTVVELGNNLATTESEIVDFGLRIAGAGRIAGLNQAQILAIGAAMSSVGVQAEAGGTAVQKVLIAMTKAVEEGEEQLDTFATVAGLTAKEFADTFEKDAAAAFTFFVEGLARSGDQAFEVLNKLGLEDQRLTRAFLSLANAGDLLTRSIDMSTTAFDENTALTEEATKRYETAESSLRILANQVNEIFLRIDKALRPAFSRLVDVLGPLIKRVQDLISENPKLVAVLFGVTAAIGAVAIGLIGLSVIIPGLTAVIGGFSLAIGLAGTVIGGLVTAIGLLFTPIGLIGGAIALFAVAWIRNWGGIRDKTRDFIQDLLDYMSGVANNVIKTINVVIRGINKVRDFLDRDPIPELKEINLQFDAIKNKAEDAFEAAGTKVKEFIDKAVLFFKGLPAKVVPGIDSIIEKFNQLTGENLPSLSSIIDTVKSRVGDFVNSAKSGFDALFESTEQMGESLESSADQGVKALDDLDEKVFDLTQDVKALNLAFSDVSQEQILRQDLSRRGLDIGGRVLEQLAGSPALRAITEQFIAGRSLRQAVLGTVAAGQVRAQREDIRRIFEGLREGTQDVSQAVSAIASILSTLTALTQARFPGFAHGGTSAGGTAIVGERGPEIMNLPYGSRITPVSRNTTYNVNAHYSRSQEPQSIALDLQSLILMAGA